MLVIVPALSLIFLRGPAPAQDENSIAKTKHVGPKAGLTTMRVLATPAFWLILLAVIPLLGGVRALQTNLVPIIADAQGDAQYAAYILSLMAFASAGGALIVGWLADRMDPRVVLTGVSTIFAAGLIALWTQPGIQVAGASILVLGLATGGVIPLLGVFVVRCFGPEGYAPVAGLMGPFMIPAVFGPVAAGYLRDLTGDYQSFFAFAALIVGAGIIAVWRLGGQPLRGAPPILRPEPALDG